SQQLADPHTVHCEKVLATVAVDAIRARQFRVLLDSNHGAGSLLGRQLLTALGCQFTILGEAPDGQFAHQPEPLADNLKNVSLAVQQGDFDIGFCQDPDADRLAVIDEDGSYIGEELTLALCLLQALAKRPGTVVTNCATSGLSKVIAAEHGCKLLQSAVGEANVADLMIAEQAVFGGEGNGGPIDPLVGYVRDSFVGMARILDLLASSRSQVSELVASFPKLSIVKDKIELDTSRLPKLFDLLMAEIKDADSSRQDGLKLEWSDRWLLVRGSNTEPIVRFIAEAPSIAEAQALCDRARKLSAKL
ncbi:MAG: phosphoglucosamine mutase, partial [Aureliella sp.]